MWSFRSMIFCQLITGVTCVQGNKSLRVLFDSIFQQCIRAPPRRGRYWEIHPRRPKDFPRPERFPEGEARGKSRGSREIWRAEGMDFPIPPEFWWSTDNLSASIFLQGVDQKILPCGEGRIDSVKINPSLLMMRDCPCLWIIHA